jgi:hypothetical protein
VTVRSFGIWNWRGWACCGKWGQRVFYTRYEAGSNTASQYVSRWQGMALRVHWTTGKTVYFVSYIYLHLKCNFVILQLLKALHIVTDCGVRSLTCQWLALSTADCPLFVTSKWCNPS